MAVNDAVHLPFGLNAFSLIQLPISSSVSVSTRPAQIHSARMWEPIIDKP
jgi:hypothetical protein